MLNIYHELSRILSSGGQAAVVTVIAADRSTPRGIGAKMLVKSDGSILGTVGGGAIEAVSIKLALEALKTGQIIRKSFNLVPDQEPGMVCGGEMEVLVEPVLQKPTIYIFGGGHIGFTLAKIAKILGFDITVVDNRPEFAAKERFPDADLILCEDYLKSFERLNISFESYIVIVTHGHKNDEHVLEEALKTPARYIGMIGSRSKVQTVFNHLSSRGVDKSALEKVHSPIGLEIQAETPEEISISILAEIIQVRRSTL